MKKIFLHELADPLSCMGELLLVYQALKKASKRENNLRSFLIADLMISSLQEAKEMYNLRYLPFIGKYGHYYYSVEPFFFLVEDTDSVDTILSKRFSFVYNGAIG